MLEMNCRYWYKDDFIKLSGNMTHEAYIENNFYKLFPNKKPFENGVIPLNFALDNGYARISTSKDELVCLYGKSFEKQKQLYADIVASLNPRIKHINIERINCEKNFFMSMSVEEFLNSDSLVRVKDTNQDADNFNIGDLVRCKDIVTTDELVRFSLSKNDVGIVVERSLDIEPELNEYSVYWKSKGKFWWIPFDNLELVKKFEWPEQ